MRRRGRPPTFDRDEALDTAMRLFWRHGFEGVSVDMLTAAIGIGPPSLYAAFESKERLYLAAVERYEGLADLMDISVLESAGSLDDAVGELLRSAASAVIRRGCMISDGMLTVGPGLASLSAHLKQRREVLRQTLATGLRRFVEESAADSLSRYVMAVLSGLSVQARDGATAAELEKIANLAVRGVAAHSPAPVR